MILAGGLGTRLRGVIGAHQKAVADVGGQPFMTYILGRLNEAGIRKTIICTGYQGRQVQNLLGGSFQSMTLVYSQESETLGTAGALKFASQLIHSRLALVLNGDSYCDVDLAALHRWHSRKNASNTIVLAHVPDTGRYGRVVVDERDAVVHFEEKNRHNAPGWISAGVYLLERKTIDGIPADRSVSIEKETFPGLIGCGFYGYKTTGHFIDIGTPASYAQAEQVLSKKVTQ
jgi:D-glycero-alpha-D-manno-heptose 1-phosphate guanylyltransferase